MNKQIENSRFTAYILQLVIVTLFVCSYLFTDRIFRNDLKYFTHTHTHTRKWYKDITFVYLYGKKISVVIKNTAYSNDLSRFYYVFTTVSNTTFSTSHNILNILFFLCHAGYVLVWALCHVVFLNQEITANQSQFFKQLNKYQENKQTVSLQCKSESVC